METQKGVLNFCNAAVFYDYKKLGNIDEFNKARKCIINTFHETTPVERIIITLSTADVVSLKFNDNDIENIIENLHDLRATTLYMIGSEKVVNDDADKVLN